MALQTKYTKNELKNSPKFFIFLLMAPVSIQSIKLKNCHRPFFFPVATLNKMKAFIFIDL